MNGAVQQRHEVRSEHCPKTSPFAFWTVRLMQF